MQKGKVAMGSERKTLCVDFDGVLHSYTSGWRGVDQVPDGPVPGAVDWLRAMLGEGFDVCIYSSRSKDPTGVAAMMAALRVWGMDMDDIERLDFPIEKPAAWLTIDDRCFRFEGDFPSADWLRRFRPWNK
jgi:hypothetical protein